ncbi:uncharacterized protein [Dermacentor albipictus]|uniref:uncharacterized protein isoform X3 n=1 Tax=Dermacentor albipictus TaxID=60249 RepID=UPI0031FD85D9
MGKVKLKATKGNSDDKRPLDLKKGDSKPLVAGGQPEVQGSATGLGPALSTAVAGMAKTKKQKRKMRHEAFIRTVDLSWAGLASSAVSSATWRCCHLFKMAVVLHTSTTLDMCKNQDQVDWKLVQSQHIRQLEAGKIVKRKRWKKACVPRALDLKNLVDALPTMVERTAVKLGHHSSYSGTATCSQLLHGQSGDGDAAAGHSRWDQHGDCRVHRQDYAERRRQVPMGIVPPSASNSGQKRGRDESLGHPRASKQARSCWRRT